MNDKQATRMMSIILVSMAFFLGGCNNEKQQKPQQAKTQITAAPKIDSIKKIDTVKSFISTAINYDTTKKYIYLTFDDGPQNGTVACFELCKKLGVKATFFMVGQHAATPHLKQIVSDIKNNYPQSLLANHSTTHANGKYHYFYHHQEMAAEDFYLAQKTLDVPFKIIRLPGNTSWVRESELRSNDLTKPVCKILDSSGYNVIGWDVEWNFNHKTANPVQSPERLARTIATRLDSNDLNVKNHLVILTHDRMFRNQNYTDSLAKFITLLKENKNYIFETVDHYPGLKKLN
jgi:peptidoglycan/xylan/chitin deacetylase (PgdA/CDA1 family)